MCAYKKSKGWGTTAPKFGVPGALTFTGWKGLRYHDFLAPSPVADTAGLFMVKLQNFPGMIKMTLKHEEVY